MVTLSFAYPYGHSLDSAYYLTQHMPKVKSVLASFPDAPYWVRQDIHPGKMHYQLTLSISFPSVETMHHFLADPRIPDLQTDIANFYGGEPCVFMEEHIEI